MSTRSAVCEPLQVASPRELYLCEDNDLVGQFFDETDAALRAAGMLDDSDDVGVCPALMAEHDQRMAELELIRLTVAALGIPHPIKMEHQQQLVSLTRSLVGQ